MIDTILALIVSIASLILVVLFGHTMYKHKKEEVQRDAMRRTQREKLTAVDESAANSPTSIDDIIARLRERSRIRNSRR